MNFHNPIRYAVLASTNEFIMRSYRKLPHGTVVVADTQTKGRGRFNRKWHSGRGGLWFSVLLKHKKPEKTFLLTFAAAVSVAKAIREQGLPAVIKWPNDILIHGRKVCGILTENVVAGKSVATVVGIGINVNNHVGLASATTLKSEKGIEIDKESLLKDVLRYYARYCDAYTKDSYSSILRDWKLLWDSGGKKVRVTTVRGVVSGVAAGISGDGSLIVRAKGREIIVVEGDLVQGV